MIILKTDESLSVFMFKIAAIEHLKRVTGKIFRFSQLVSDFIEEAETFLDFLPVFRIRIHFLRIRIQRLRLETNTDPDPDPIRIQGFNDQKFQKNYS
jgi:hypothetical protein